MFFMTYAYWAAIVVLWKISRWRIAGQIGGGGVLGKYSEMRRGECPSENLVLKTVRRERRPDFGPEVYPVQ
jgi:hypothetical protein